MNANSKSIHGMKRLFIGVLAPFLFLSCQTVHNLTPDRVENRFYSYAGFPHVVDYPNPLIVLYNEGYVVGYDEIRGVPAWASYRVFRVDEYITHPRPGRFLVDNRTENRISHDHYTNSGFDRGHMAPNFAIVTRYGVQAQRETFLMTNIIPQTPQLNRQWWARLERLIARDYSEAFGEVWVTTGPVFKEKGNWIGGDVKIPSHNFMILTVEVENDLWMKAFLVPQNIEGNEKLEPYLISVQDIEEHTGLDFNPTLNSNISVSLESEPVQELWLD